MITCAFALAADHIIRDGENNNVTIVNVLEQLRSSIFPLALHKVTILFFFKRDRGDPQVPPMRMRIRLDNEQIFDDAVAVNFGDQLANRAIVQLQGLPIARPGALRFEAMLDGRVLGGWEVTVIAVAAQAGQHN